MGIVPWRNLIFAEQTVLLSSSDPHLLQTAVDSDKRIEWSFFLSDFGVVFFSAMSWDIASMDRADIDDFTSVVLHGNHNENWAEI